ncbi:hypothetical protein [Gemmobacter sp. 24YEA27]|uniref:hypothetical protein n=1 Tax=Gemmobacter sp. 24YEA27 TaxID=3040672 RepID=UPI0024B39783|nr:hypothetical protein [Gemmobacter sp. 24YEA27]
MARRDRQSQLFRDLIARLSPEMQRAVITAWEDIRASIDWIGLKEALERQDVDRAISALNIEPAAFEAYRAAATSAYAQGGALAATTINAPAGSRVSFRFDMTNPRAEAWISQNVGEMITGLADTAKDVARQSILTGYQAGRHGHRKCGFPRH